MHKTFSVFAIFVSVFFTLSHAFTALADDAAQSRAQAFKAVTGPVKESVPGGPLLLAAYAVAWLLIFFYIWRIHAQQKELARRIEALKTAGQRQQ